MKPFGEDRATNSTNWPCPGHFVGGTGHITTGLTTLGARQYNAQLCPLEQQARWRPPE